MAERPPTHQDFYEVPDAPTRPAPGLTQNEFTLWQHVNNSELRLRGAITNVKGLIAADIKTEREKTDAQLDKLGTSLGKVASTVSEINAKMQVADLRTATQRDWVKWFVPIAIGIAIAIFNKLWG